MTARVQAKIMAMAKIMALKDTEILMSVPTVPEMSREVLTIQTATTRSALMVKLMARLVPRAPLQAIATEKVVLPKLQASPKGSEIFLPKIQAIASERVARPKLQAIATERVVLPKLQAIASPIASEILLLISVILAGSSVFVLFV